MRQSKEGDISFWILKLILVSFIALRFFDFIPSEMRNYSIVDAPLGDNGQNLSGVFQSICNNEKQKQVLLQYLQELTPMDARNLEFFEGPDGKVLLQLVEENGQKITVFSASDGTLRFLAMIGSLFKYEDFNLLFYEEIENGIHPTRLHLLVEFLEKKAKDGNIQIIGTTHSPHLLGFLSEESLEHVSLTYRLPDEPDCKIQKILDIPDARRVIEKYGALDLHESGWFENAMYFDSDDEGDSK